MLNIRDILQQYKQSLSSRTVAAAADVDERYADAIKELDQIIKELQRLLSAPIGSKQKSKPLDIRACALLGSGTLLSEWASIVGETVKSYSKPPLTEETQLEIKDLVETLQKPAPKGAPWRASHGKDALKKALNSIKTSRDRLNHCLHRVGRDSLSKLLRWMGQVYDDLKIKRPSSLDKWEKAVEGLDLSGSSLVVCMTCKQNPASARIGCHNNGRKPVGRDDLINEVIEGCMASLCLPLQSSHMVPLLVSHQTGGSRLYGCAAEGAALACAIDRHQRSWQVVTGPDGVREAAE